MFFFNLKNKCQTYEAKINKNKKRITTTSRLRAATFSICLIHSVYRKTQLIEGLLLMNWLHANRFYFLAPSAAGERHAESNGRILNAVKGRSVVVDESRRNPSVPREIHSQVFFLKLFAFSNLGGVANIHLNSIVGTWWYVFEPL